MRTIKKIVIGVMIYWVVFVAAMIFLFCKYQSVPDSLIQYGLGGGSVELLAAAFIEISKNLIDKKYKQDVEVLDFDELTNDKPEEGEG